ncbi:MAG: pyrimidine 5'-nucleotidase [Armatimonadota bacterium]
MLNALLFDLDETLYRPACGMLAAGDRRITDFLADRLGLSHEDADDLRVHYYKKYGTTAAGCEIELDIPQAEFYAASVEQVDPQRYLSPAPRLQQMLADLQAELFVFTNATHDYARRALDVLGVTEHFERIFDIEFAGWRPKPDPGAYEKVVEAVGRPGAECGLVEDNPANLPPARDLGMTTFLLRAHHPDADFRLDDILDLRQLLDGLQNKPAGS